MYIEVVVGAATRPGQLVPRNEIHYTSTEEEVYYSVFGMDQRIHAHVAAQQPIQAFDGTYSADFLYFVVQREGDLTGALEAARRLLELFFDRFGLSASKLLLYYSGRHGFHIGLSQHLFGEFEPSPQLPGQLAALSQHVLAACFALDVETLDLLESGMQAQRPGRHFADVVPGVQQPGRLLRAPNSRHAATGCYKVPLYAFELLTLTLGELLTLAAQPRPHFTRLAAVPVETNPALATLWQRARGRELAAPPAQKVAQEESRLFLPAPSEPTAGALARQAGYLLRHSQLERTHIRDLLTVLNRTSYRPVTAGQLDELFTDALAQCPGAPRVPPGSVMPYQGLPWAGPAPPYSPPFVRRDAQRPVYC